MNMTAQVTESRMQKLLTKHYSRIYPSGMIGCHCDEFFDTEEDWAWHVHAEWKKLLLEIITEEAEKQEPGALDKAEDDAFHRAANIFGDLSQDYKVIDFDSMFALPDYLNAIGENPEMPGVHPEQVVSWNKAVGEAKAKFKKEIL